LVKNNAAAFYEWPKPLSDRAVEALNPNMTLFTAQNASRYLLFALYLAAGINHFVMPHFYHPLIPDYFGHKALINHLSGVAEILLAIGVLWQPTRRYAAFGIVLLLLAFVPAHVWMIEKGGCFTPDSFCFPVWLMWVRLLVLHPILLWWAWRVGKDAKTLPHGQKLF
jgi:uncharacterized membrane protein